ncbi:DUF3341 domain-containing protein [Planctomicrobium piriforme]|uniref:Quinol:cytochrome c oxidoreductase membrane protein n=1 Tax=Planctomicrobium piriforme TaxID=1576369 RepID=A0A1I3JEY2_9PLAN|nr:DUF3341 domain-containing protein [Planctomicrobium piriforme]SFI58831.1 Protein of unknown function [Planctomicrobium piriforme]
MNTVPPDTYGLLAEFPDSDSLIEAAQALTDRGYRKVEAYSSFPIEGLAEALNFHRSWIPLVVFIGGVAGCIIGFSMQYWISVYAYPLNIGGRPTNSWPLFIPVTFELTILLAASSAVFGMLALNGLPRPYHPLFAVPQFSKASLDGYFIGIQAIDPLFDMEATTKLLHELHAKEVLHVPSGE